MSAVQDELRQAKRRLVLRDSLAFFSLTVISVILFTLTWGIFSSFSEHRVELAQRWYQRGRADLAANRPADAVTSLRAALSYAPEQHEYQLLLAEALAQAGDDDEARAYFSTLWEAEPGDGALNLQLARLSAKRPKDKDETVRYYRASIYGVWEGDGTERRRAVRLELIRYLIRIGNLGSAQNELLIAAGNATDDPGVRLEIAGLMAQAGDFNSALTQYQRLLAVDPGNVAAREGAAEIAFQLGHFATVAKLLHDETGGSVHLQTLLERTTRILALNPADGLSNNERVARILKLRQIAQTRWDACMVKIETPSSLPAALPTAMAAEVQALAVEWKNDEAKTLRASLPGSLDRQQREISLVYRTEALANRVCGAASGDDELVTLLAKSAGTVQQ
jgi:tetratricopeptide (TPR) repeat protein